MRVIINDEIVRRRKFFPGGVSAILVNKTKYIKVGSLQHRYSFVFGNEETDICFELPYRRVGSDFVKAAITTAIIAHVADLEEDFCRDEICFKNYRVAQIFG